MSPSAAAVQRNIRISPFHRPLRNYPNTTTTPTLSPVCLGEPASGNGKRLLLCCRSPTTTTTGDSPPQNHELAPEFYPAGAAAAAVSLQTTTDRQTATLSLDGGFWQKGQVSSQSGRRPYGAMDGVAGWPCGGSRNGSILPSRRHPSIHINPTCCCCWLLTTNTPPPPPQSVTIPQNQRGIPNSPQASPVQFVKVQRQGEASSQQKEEEMRLEWNCTEHRGC